MKTTFGQRDRNEPAPPPAQPVAAAPVFHEEPVGDSLSILRERVLKEVDSSAVGNMPTDVLEHRLEVIIHEIANTPAIDVRVRCEVVDGAGDDRLESVTVRDNRTGACETRRASATSFRDFRSATRSGFPADTRPSRSRKSISDLRKSISRRVSSSAGGVAD